MGEKVVNTKFSWRADARFSVPAEAAGRELERIRHANGGLLCPSHVVEAAQNPDNPLHPMFTWDVRRAAEKHWLGQARRIINAIEVTVEYAKSNKPSQTIVAFVHTEKRQQGYRPTLCLKDNPADRQMVLGEARRQLEAWKKRFGHLVELTKLAGSIEDALRNLFGEKCS